LALAGFDDSGKPIGIGGDDKTGIFICLQLLEKFDNIKAAFFVSEETGMLGSRELDKSFLQDVGYAIQFDAPGTALVTEVCHGTQLFERDTNFFRIVDQTLNQFEEPIYASHPFTDIMQVKRKSDFACINLSCAYYGMHTQHEFVDVEDVFFCLDKAAAMITALGETKYDYKVDYEALERQHRERMQELQAKRMKDLEAMFPGFGNWKHLFAQLDEEDSGADLMDPDDLEMLFNGDIEDDDEFDVDFPIDDVDEDDLDEDEDLN
jgi:hypothetical protein